VAQLHDALAAFEHLERDLYSLAFELGLNEVDLRDLYFVGHHRISSPSSGMPRMRAATYRGSRTRAVPKNCASAVTFSSTDADASGVVR
jgi:hypothetical protein